MSGKLIELHLVIAARYRALGSSAYAEERAAYHERAAARAAAEHAFPHEKSSYEGFTSH